MSKQEIASHITGLLLNTNDSTAVFEYVNALARLATVPSTIFPELKTNVVEIATEYNIKVAKPDTVPGNKSELDRQASIQKAFTPTKLPTKTKVTVTTNNTSTGDTVVATHITDAIIDTFDDLSKQEADILLIVRARGAKGRVSENLLLSGVASSVGYSKPQVMKAVRDHLSNEFYFVRGADMPEGAMYPGKSPTNKRAYYIVPVAFKKDN